MTVTMTDDELDDGLRELFGSFEVHAIDPVAGRAQAARRSVSRTAAVAWAAPCAALIAIVSTMSYVYVHASPTNSATSPATTEIKSPKTGHPSPFSSITMYILPGASLHGGQAVTVSLHLAPHTDFRLSECASIEATNPKGCGPASSFEFGTSDSSGHKTTEFRVSSLAASGFGSVPATTCTSQCVIEASTGKAFLDAVAISFAPIVFPTFKAGYRAPDCTFSQLRVTWSPGASGGNVRLLLTFENTSSATCSLYGYPGVAALDSAGKQVAQARRTLNGWSGGIAPGQSPQVVNLAPRESASAIVEGTDIPVANDTSLCHSYPKLLVTPPNTERSVVEDGTFGSCSGIQVHPIVAGETGSSPPGR